MMFMTPDRPFMMNVITFGFANVPPCFQRWMSDVLAPVAHRRVENYLDDTGSHHENLTEHIQTNREILSCFRNAGMFANATKCEFHKETLEFLGVDVIG